MRYLAAALALFALIAVRARLSPVAAADSETVTWGATDPTWSPDGQRLAFSLFGSIWQAPADGGEARQISASPGYDAHPSWSPRGDKIVFVRGRFAPFGRIPNVSGALTIVDVETGQERELETPNPTAGTPVWSPDGSRIVCGLQSGNAGSLLHEISLADGRIRQMQFRPMKGPAGNWTAASWDSRHDQIFFAAQRLGPDQIWTMPAAARPVMVQLPLTLFRPEQVLLIHSFSSLPDGSGVVYSANEVNGKGDYELYRLGAKGGKPAPITRTERDEFAPAVSPDGRRIAYVSNQLGNIDLFTIPISGGVGKHVRITALKFRRPSGRVRIQVRDELGNRTPVRLYVRASDGKAYCPSGSMIYYYNLEPRPVRDGFFLASGDDTFPVPAGTLQLIAMKGIEYDIADRKVEVAAGDTADVTIDMRRWTNWAERGWQTGENHFHLNYHGIYYLKPPQALRWLQAEDLNTASMKVANEDGAFIHDKEFFRGAVEPISQPRNILYWGQEYRNRFPFGHMAFLNIKRQVPPSFTSEPGTKSPYDFPLNTMAALEARKQGGLVVYVHPTSQSTDVFDSNLGAKEMAVGTALGAVDAIDILPFGESAYELWYRFLNCGFHVSPGAGTDVFTNYRGVNSIPGGAREYVEVGPVMNWDRWIERLRQGRDFVTNGPLVEFTVNGQPMGSVLQAPAGQPYRAKLVAEITSRVPFDTVEFIRNGEVIERKGIEPRTGAFRLEREETVEKSCWFAVRLSGKPARGIVGNGIPRAHSAAIYVNAGGAPTLIREDLELMIRWIDRLWALLQERDNFGPAANRAQARRLFDQARENYIAKLAKAQ